MNNLEILVRTNPSTLIAMEFKKDLDETRIRNLENEMRRTKNITPKNILGQYFEFGYKFSSMLFFVNQDLATNVCLTAEELEVINNRIKKIENSRVDVMTFRDYYNSKS
jgi:hypothetical protein